MNTRWKFPLSLEKHGSGSLSQQIVTAFIHEISRGRLVSGMLLPGTRRLAAELNVHRNTVVAAYEDLASQGWVTTVKGKGTIVSPSLTLAQQTVCQKKPSCKQEQKAPILHRIDLNDGHPDARLFPMNVFARTMGRMIRQRGQRLYHASLEPQGNPKLRWMLAEMLRTRRGLDCHEDDLLISRGSQQALFLVGQALKRLSSIHSLSGASKKILVESPGYVPASKAFQLAGFDIVPIPVDQDGIRMDVVEQYVSQSRDVVAIYVTPHHQYPTTVSMKAERRVRLLDIAFAHKIWVIEDDYDHDFYYGSRPILPLASLQKNEQVIYIGSLSKIVSVGLRIGYIVAPPFLLKELISLRTLIDRIGDPILEETVADMMEEGQLQRHTNKMRIVYEQRKTRFCNKLSSQNPSLQFQVPQGGMAVWVPFPNGIQHRSFTRTLINHEILPLDPALYCHEADQKVTGTRIGFASLNEEESDQVVKGLHFALQ